MPIHLVTEKSARLKFHHEILMTLLRLTPERKKEPSPPAPEKWVTTRDVADAHQISIYKARQILLALVTRDLVMVSDGKVNNSLRWYPKVFMW